MTIPAVGPTTEKQIAETIRALKRNEFLAFFLPDAGEGKKLVLDVVRAGMSVGLGGSETLRQMGLPAALQAKGAVVLDHWDESLSLDETFRTRQDQLRCDLFLSSVNAVTEQGELVSRDGIGNRICASTFGPKKVILVAGVQKIVPDLPAALERIRQVAAPLRARSLNLDLPCTRGNGCVDCWEASRICRATLILHRRPMLTDITVVLIGESLGF